ncbi:MAG: hypothetical protein KDA31_05915 [Phycisphaerales bacterium]|nr:hypothetical protein [Phycisphaerales bacterium]MCB9837516.1 hypothetical protein [Phycisphaera sp.]
MLATALGASAQPIVSGVPGLARTDSVASARLGGFSAFADASTDTVVVRDASGQTLRTITRAEIAALAPWMTLDGSYDGPVALAFSDSGRRLYIAVADASLPGDGLASDVVLLYDRYENALVRFARLELATDEATPKHLAALHHRGTLYVSNAFGNLYGLSATRNQSTSSVTWSTALTDLSVIRGLAVDQAGGLLFATGTTGLYRAPITQQPPTLELVIPITGVRAIAYSSHFGAGDGLYLLTDEISGTQVRFAGASLVRGFTFFTPSPYATLAQDARDLASTATGALLVGAPSEALTIREGADPRLTYEAWLDDEFAQQVTFAKGLISPDGEPAGWVIDADVTLGASRFHPATPDGACWVILTLLASDELTGDAQAQPMIREVLMRYAGRLPGPAPARSADGFFTHWIDPNTGSTQGGWGAEFATYSTMKIVAAAIRARAYYPNDAEIREAAQAIVCGVSNWDAYFRANNDEVYLKSLGAGGADHSAWNPAFTEGLVFVEQANAFGGGVSQNAWTRWINRNLWPTATFVLGRPVTGESPGGYLPVFITAYSLLLQEPFRNNASWMTHVRNVLVSHAAWTDENGPRLFTVFSAGTTKPEWGGYNADSLSNHPGDVTTLTALMALGATGEHEPAWAAYNAYRQGARASFASGASMLYRRSAIDPNYTPNSAGLPDVSMGALGLAELIQPGFVDAVLAVQIPANFCDDPCLADTNGDGAVTPADFSAWVAAFNAMAPQCDQNGDGACTPADFSAWVANYNAGC